MNKCMLTLVLIATPLMAQEESPSAPEAPLAPVDIDELLEKFTSDLQAAKFDKEELDRVIARVREALRQTRGTQTDEVASFQFAPDLKFVINGVLGDETMTGTWSEPDGSNGRYTLSSLGKGRYRLLAMKSGKDDTKAEYKDEGTLVELRKKYPFLQRFTMIRMVPTPIDPKSIVTVKTQVYHVSDLVPTPALSVVPKPEIKLIKTLGIIVRRPSKELEYHLKLPTETTWIVESVLPNAKHGLRQFDLLTEADGVDLSELKTLRDAKKVLVVTRRGKTMRIALDG